MCTLAATVLTAVAQECLETLSNIEGPFYRAGSPERTDITIEGQGPTLTLTGYVVGWDCNPIEGAWLDFWHCDPDGVYDNSSADYRFRGHQYATDTGAWTLVTNIPAQYAGRPKHIHVKVQGEISDILTTQLYFPDDPFNANDPWHEDELEFVITEESPNGDISGTYYFQLDEPGSPDCPEDLNQDGTINGADLTLILSAWGESNPDFDLNGDNVVNGADLTFVLAGWGPCTF